MSAQCGKQLQGIPDLPFLVLHAVFPTSLLLFVNYDQELECQNPVICCIYPIVLAGISYCAGWAGSRIN